MPPIQSTLISSRRSCILLKVSGQIAIEVHNFSKRISPSLADAVKASRGGESRITSAGYENSQIRDKRCHLVRCTWLTQWSFVLSNHTKCYRLRQHLHNHIAWQMYDTVQNGAKFRSSRNELGMFAYKRVCENTTCQEYGPRNESPRSSSFLRDNVASRGNRFLSRKTPPPFRACEKVLVPRYRCQ